MKKFCSEFSFLNDFRVGFTISHLFKGLMREHLQNLFQTENVQVVSKPKIRSWSQKRGSLYSKLEKQKVPPQESGNMTRHHLLRIQGLSRRDIISTQ